MEALERAIADAIVNAQKQFRAGKPVEDVVLRVPPSTVEQVAWLLLCGEWRTAQNLMAEEVEACRS